MNSVLIGVPVGSLPTLPQHLLNPMHANECLGPSLSITCFAVYSGCRIQMALMRIRAKCNATNFDLLETEDRDGRICSAQLR